MMETAGLNHHRKLHSDVVKYHSNISAKDNSKSELGGLNQGKLFNPKFNQNLYAEALLKNS